MSVLESFQDGEQVLLIDQRGKRHLLTLRKGETFHSDRGWIPHNAIIGHPDGSWVRSSLGLRHLALRPTLAEYVLEMPRGAQVIYPKDLAMILFWADVYPGCRVLEAGTGSSPGPSGRSPGRRGASRGRTRPAWDGGPGTACRATTAPSSRPGGR